MCCSRKFMHYWTKHLFILPIETLPNTASGAAGVPGPLGVKFPKCHDDELLVLKATSQAALHTMESALNILQDLRDLQVNHVTRHYRSASPLALSPKKTSFSQNKPLKEQNSPNDSACGSPTRIVSESSIGKSIFYRTRLNKAPGFSFSFWILCLKLSHKNRIKNSF